MFLNRFEVFMDINLKFLNILNTLYGKKKDLGREFQRRDVL